MSGTIPAVASASSAPSGRPAALDEGARALTEAKRFPFCTQDGLAALCRDAGLSAVTVAPIDTEIVFPDFESF